MQIIPLPARIKQQQGNFLLSPELIIQTDSVNINNANHLRLLLENPTGYHISIQTLDGDPQKAIRMSINRGLEGLGREGYRLEVLPERIRIESADESGIFYGIQTLRQLLPLAVEDRQTVSGIEWAIPCVLIEDKPRFPWRGFMLDESRHFFGKETVLLLLDLMALQKLNVFHWHLTDDQGWRIEIKKYPKLTGIGSVRAGTSKTMLGKENDGIMYTGFYTQEEIKEIVTYASARSITIVPEIEMPGHSLAALASYPELACSGGPFEVATRFGIFPDIYCAGKEIVFNFLQDVLDEILEIFPSPYIHIGGDEAPKKRWKSCPDCQRRIRDLQLKDEHELQRYFTNRMVAYLRQKKHQVIGWNEILQDGLGQEVIVQFWARGRGRMLEAVNKMKREVIMSNYLDTYLDHSYSLMPLSRAYNFEPIPAGLPDKDASCFLGLEFPLWSEWVANRPRLDYQVFPRLTAMAETGWTPKENKDLDDFRRRLLPFLERLDKYSIGYAPIVEAEPPMIKQIFGIFTIAFPQTGIAG